MRVLIAGMMTVTAALSLPANVRAEGFSTHDLTPFATRVTEAIGTNCQPAADPARLTLLCPDVKGPLVDIFLRRRDSGDRIEQNMRAGKTGQAELEALCRKINDRCAVTLLDVAPAVGWIGAQPMGRQALSTAVLVRDGDELVVRALASDPQAARAAVEKALAIVRPVIGD